MLAAIPTRDDVASSEPRSLLTWILPASVLLHALAVGLMPDAPKRVRFPAPAVVVEMAEAPPPPPPPPEPAQDPAPAPDPMPARPAPATRAAAPASPRAAATESSSAANDAPLDFTSTTFGGDGPGVALGSTAPRGAGPVASVRTPTAVRVAVPVVAASSLGRPPRAPGLDAELERNYPVEARRSGISGSATLQVELREDGRVGKVVPVSESYPGFGPACERTVRAGKWEPPIDREGRPVRTEIKYVCKFEVRS